MKMQPSWAALAVVALALHSASCYTTRKSSIDSLRRIDEEVTCRIRYDDRELRARLSPLDVVNDEFIECRPCTHDGSSWRVRFSGWPAVYRSGKYWRNAVAGEPVRIPRERIDSVRVEKLDWPLTIVSSPLSIPVGIIDFLVDNVEIGFDTVDNRHDSSWRSAATARQD